MAISERVARLRRLSLDAVPSIATERAELITEFYGQQGPCLYSIPVQRALSFKYLMEHKTIYLGDGELIVGEKGPAPKATPTFPELCCHSLSDLDILNSREKIPFAVSVEARRTYEERIVPFWAGHSMRDLLFAEMTGEWRAAYDAGIFTEFMEQRAPGHTVLDDKILSSRHARVQRGYRSQPELVELPGRPAGLRQAGRAEGDGHLCGWADPLRRAPRRAGARAGGGRARPRARRRAPADRRGLPARACPRPA